MSSFQTSTHCLHWRVSVEDQRRKRKLSFVSYCNAKDSHSAATIHSAIAPPPPAVGDGEEDIQSQTHQCLDADSEAAVLQYFSELLRRDCGPAQDRAINTTWRVPNTAVVYFRRFYLHNSLFAHDPRVLLVACLLLAGKTEEEFVPPTLLVRSLHPTLSDAQLQAAEEALLQGLGYELQVYHPHSCLHALLADIKVTRFRGGGNSNSISSSIKQWSVRAEPFIEKLLDSEVCLSALPVTIALAALLRTEPSPPLEMLMSPDSSESNHAFSLRTYVQGVLGADAGGEALAEALRLQPIMDEEPPPPELLKAPLKLLASLAAWSSKDKKSKGGKKKLKREGGGEKDDSQVSS